MFAIFLQAAPVLVAANHEQKKKYLGRLIDEPLMAVRTTEMFTFSLIA